MSALWTITLVDANGNNLTESGLALAGQKKFTFQLGAPNSCVFQLPLASQEASIIASTDPSRGPGAVYVKAYRQAAGASSKVLRFYGPCWVDEIPQSSGGMDTLLVTAYDPSIYLTKRYTTLTASGDQGALLKTMIDTTNTNDGETGIRTNTSNITTSATVTIDNSTQQPTIASVQSQFNAQLDGAESWVLPIELSSGKMCDFYAALRRGADKADAVTFGYGVGTKSNCVIGRVRNMDNVENDTTGYSDALSYDAIDLTSVAALRRLKSLVSYTGETNLVRLSARTLGRLADRSTVNAVAEYTVKPTSRAPVLFDDYDIGDSGILDFNHGIAFTTSQRILSVQLDVTDAGVEIPSTIALRAA